MVDAARLHVGICRPRSSLMHMQGKAQAIVVDAYLYTCKYVFSRKKEIMEEITKSDT